MSYFEANGIPHKKRARNSLTSGKGVFPPLQKNHKSSGSGSNVPPQLVLKGSHDEPGEG